MRNKTVFNKNFSFYFALLIVFASIIIFINYVFDFGIARLLIAVILSAVLAVFIYWALTKK